MRRLPTALRRTDLYLDPDGRVASLTSPTLGTATRTYDADGRLASATDSSGEIDPGTISYAYYGDGLRSSLGLAIPALSFNQANLFSTVIDPTANVRRW